MDHTSSAALVVAADLGWSGVDSWSALSEVVDRDASGNTLMSNVLVEDVRDCYIRAENRREVVIGVASLGGVDTVDGDPGDDQ